jgi:hypothetical protein
VGEWIVEFVAGIDEPAARAMVAAAGGQVRRRMRSDGPLTLLARGAPPVAAALGARPEVARVEANGGGYHTR